MKVKENTRVIVNIRTGENLFSFLTALLKSERERERERKSRVKGEKS